MTRLRLHMNLSAAALVVLVACIAFQWTQQPPRVDWSPTSVTTLSEQCPPHTTPVLVFGATSMLGKYIMERFREERNLCLISFARSSCSVCNINIKGNMKDVRFVDRVLEHYKPKTVLTSVKPPLMGVHYRTYIELNMLAMMELAKLSKKHNVENFIYVSSIAAAGHYHEHSLATESDEQPYYTEYEAPYDVSKRVAEDFILGLHETDVFNTISIRTSGIMGGAGDPYDEFHTAPILFSFEPPAPPVDCNHAANIADALYIVYDTMLQRPEVGGQFYYYTGYHCDEAAKAQLLSERTGKYHFKIPHKWVMDWLPWLFWAKWDPHQYTYVDMVRMGATIQQTFDQSKFHAAFPAFKAKYSLEQAMDLYVGGKKD